jgi:hypothetical protein
LRWLLVAGAMAVIRYARQHGTKRPWLARLMDRRPVKVVAVALANKIARMAWAMMVRGEVTEIPQCSGLPAVRRVAQNRTRGCGLGRFRKLGPFDSQSAANQNMRPSLARSSGTMVRQELHPMIAQRMTMLLRAGVVSGPSAHHDYAMQTLFI